MNRFQTRLTEHRLSLRRGQLQTLQVNVGRKCNQACRHCHVNAAPWRKEMMSAEVARRVGDWIRAHRPVVVDITGGAPELSEHFRFLVEIYDCDFNQMIGMQMCNGKPLFIWDVTPAYLEDWAIQTGDHCLACTAGCGSSCTGVVR
jgi:sulfatase maturation enzyme AslB (radical SAM superfamily)